MTRNHGKKCVFCDMVAGKAPAHRIHEGRHSLAILDIFPFARGHSLVISKRHVVWWHDLSEKETEDLFRTARVVANKIQKAFKPDFVCMYARGKRIPHVHIFLIPTYSGDLLDRFFNALEKIQEAPGELVRMRDRAELAKTARLIAKS
ncbi:MAG: HIT family protein [Proteobacteria bacterium]|nr:HIT family protein [Pseudomonadota bacterium]